MKKHASVVLVNPPIKFNQRQSWVVPPLGLLYLAASLRKEGVPVVILDFFEKSGSVEEIIEEIKSHNPTIVGITVMTDRVWPALEIAQGIKAQGICSQVVLGGPHINATQAEIMTEMALGVYVDAVFVKESEQSFIKYVLGEDYKNINGLCWRDENGQIQSNPSIIPTFNLDELPFPDLRDVKNVTGYRSPYFNNEKVATIMSSRGCPFTCKFCDVHQNMGRRYRLRSPQNIVDEIKFHYEMSGVRNFIFKDSIFNLKKDHTEKLCNLITESGLKIRWMCNNRIDSVDREMLTLMRKAGCTNISFGVESLAPAVLKQMNKKLVVAKVKECFDLCREVGINTMAYMMIGCEGETYDINMSSLDELIKANPTLAQFSIATLYPGTVLYDEALSNNLLKDTKWYYIKGEERIQKGYLNLPYFPVEDQIKAANASYLRFYFRAGKLLGVAIKFFSWNLFYTGFKLLFARGRRQEF